MFVVIELTLVLIYLTSHILILILLWIDSQIYTLSTLCLCDGILIKYKKKEFVENSILTLPICKYDFQKIVYKANTHTRLFSYNRFVTFLIPTPQQQNTNSFPFDISCPVSV